MNGIVINIDPVIFRLGVFELRWYSLAIIAAITAAISIAVRQGKKKGFAPDEIYSLALWAIISGVVGARLFHVIDYFGYYLSNPGQLLHFQGLAVWGALAGGGAATVIYARIKHLPLARLADALVPALLVGQIIGRIGCIVNGDATSSMTSLPWAFIYTHPDSLIRSDLRGLPTHPYAVYEMLWNALALVIIWRLGLRLKTDGQLFLSYLSLYSVGRFILSFVRDENIIFLGLQEAQIVALLVLIGSVAAMIYLTKKHLPLEKPIEPVPTEEGG